MFYLKHNGEKLEIDHENVYNLCPKCGDECVVDLNDAVTEDGLDLYGISLYCPECNETVLGYRRQMETVSGEIGGIAARYNANRRDVEQIVLSGLDRGLSLQACLVGARLGYSTVNGGEEFFSVGDLAAAIGGSVEDAKALMEKEGVQPMKLSTLPGFEWLLQ